MSKKIKRPIAFVLTLVMALGMWAGGIPTLSVMEPTEVHAATSGAQYTTDGGTTWLDIPNGNISPDDNDIIELDGSSNSNNARIYIQQSGEYTISGSAVGVRIEVDSSVTGNVTINAIDLHLATAYGLVTDDAMIELSNSISCINVTNSSIHNTGIGTGIRTSNNMHLNVMDGTVFSIKTQGGGRGLRTGNGVSDKTITINGDVEVNSTGNGSYGFHLNVSNNLIINGNVSISAVAYGIVASGTAITGNVNIITSDNYGIQSKNITIIGDSVDIKSSNSIGLYSSESLGTIDVSAGSICIKSNGGYGVYSSGANSIVTLSGILDISGNTGIQGSYTTHINLNTEGSSTISGISSTSTSNYGYAVYAQNVNIDATGILTLKGGNRPNMNDSTGGGIAVKFDGSISITGDAIIDMKSGQVSSGVAIKNANALQKSANKYTLATSNITGYDGDYTTYESIDGSRVIVYPNSNPITTHTAIFSSDGTGATIVGSSPAATTAVFAEGDTLVLEAGTKIGIAVSSWSTTPASPSGGTFISKNNSLVGNRAVYLLPNQNVTVTANWESEGEGEGDQYLGGGSVGGSSGSSTPINRMADISGTSANTSEVGTVQAKHWAYDAINFVMKRHYMAGITNSEFAPEQKVSRAMVAQVFGNMSNFFANGYKESPYSDVKIGAWYGPAVSWAESTGIMTGIGSGKFAPEQNVTREELAVAIYKYAKIKNINMTTTGNLSKFKDSSKAAAWAKDALIWANTNGIINGRDTGYLDPKGYATRAEMASILYKFESL